MNNIVVGIDPGLGGGLAIYKDDRVVTVNMPETLTDIAMAVSNFASEAFFGGRVYAFIEEPPWSMGLNKGIGSVKLHHNRGRLEGLMAAYGVSIVNVRPQKWMKTFGLGTRSSCASDTEWKNRLKGEAQRLYPGLKITHSVADAVLIMTYGIRVLETTLRP